MDKEKLIELFQKPVKAAAKECNMNKNEFRKLHQSYGIMTWPFRSLYTTKSEDKCKKILENVFKLPMSLINTTFFDGSRNYIIFNIADDNILYRVSLRVNSVFICSCGKNNCSHIYFIICKLFHEYTFRQKYTETVIDKLEKNYIEFASIDNCCMCYNTLRGDMKVDFFDDIGTYGHVACFENCTNALNAHIYAKKIKRTSIDQDIINNKRKRRKKIVIN